MPPAEQVDNAFLRPAGLVWSTASDQARLLGFLANGDADVLPDDLRSELMAPRVPMYNHATHVQYGFGVSVQTGFTDGAGGYRAATVVGHGGQTLNMTSISLLLPDQNIAISLLANAAHALLEKKLGVPTGE